MWSTVDLREIRVFLTLAEELHFGRTGERLQITSSRVSQVLQDLETKLGGQLVYRTSRHVELTPRGERFRADIGPAHGQVVDALERAHQERDGLTGTLRIGLLTPTVEGPDLPAITAAFERRHPECGVEVGRAPYGDAFESMRRGEFDLLASWLPHGQPDMVVGPTLTREALFLGVADDHPLAQRRAVSIEEVADYRVVPMEDVQPKALVDVWVPRKTPRGRPIRRLRVPFAQMARDDPGELRGQISWWIRRGDIVHPAMEPTREIHGPGITWVPISDLKPLRSALVWPRGVRSPRRSKFVRIAREVLRAKWETARADGQPSADARQRPRSRARAQAGSALPKDH
jgi:DNA-binding transcriptional LysR family regulator